MEKGGVAKRVWNFESNEELERAGQLTIRGILEKITRNMDGGDTRPTIPLGNGDPALFPCFRTTPIAEDALISAIRSGHHNCYPPTVGILPARRAIAEYLSRDLPYKLSPDDVFLALGCEQSIEIVLSALSRPNANILLPRPGYRFYEARAAFTGIQVRHFNLIPESNWEIDLDQVKSLADENTVAMVLINPGNPCGNVFTYQHLAKVAETAWKLGILIIADEVYAHLTYGRNPFVPMGEFASIVPVLTLGSISKRWLLPGWRCGWIAANDPTGILKETKIIDSIKNYLNISTDPVTFIQAALPQILENTKEDFFEKTNNLLKQAADMFYDGIKEIDSIICPFKPEGSMFIMIKLDISHLEDILDDVDFCCKLAKEESVIILPGTAVGLENWIRITLATEPSTLKDGLGRLKSFCHRHEKKLQDFKVSLKKKWISDPVIYTNKISNLHSQGVIQGLKTEAQPDYHQRRGAINSPLLIHQQAMSAAHSIE